MSRAKSLVYGVGINDVDEPNTYKVFPEERYQSGGFKYTYCPYYIRWRDMLGRCYSKNYHEKYQTYVGCLVCKEWILFSNFRKWMATKDWEGNELDKDLLIEGNKVYSPDTCVFVTQEVNKFITDSGKSRGDTLIGSFPECKKYKSSCKSPFTKGTKGSYVGLYETELEAHLAWKYQKHLYALQLVDSPLVTDSRIREILITRYINYTILEDHIK